MKLYHGSWDKESVLEKGFTLDCESEMQALGCGVYFTDAEEYSHSYGDPISIEVPELSEWDGKSFNNPAVEEVDFSIGIIADHTPDGLHALRELEEEIYRKDAVLRMKRWDEIKQEYYDKARTIRDEFLDRGVKIGWRSGVSYKGDPYFEFVFYDVDLVNKHLSDTLKKRKI